MEKSAAYIYIQKRPVRIAFLVHPEKADLNQIARVIAYNQTKWGGRYNPIILTNGQAIENNWWRLLREVDPDVIKSLIPLGNDLVEKIDHFISPYSIEVPKDENDDSVSIRDDVMNI